MQHSIFLILILAVSMTHIQLADTCSCWPEHPQTHYCRADFVMSVKVRRTDELDDQLHYQVKVRRVFKGAAFITAKRMQSLWTAPYDSLCGQTELKNRQSYVVSGKIIAGKLTITMCDLMIPWTQVTNKQRLGFMKHYKDGCHCEIKYTNWSNKGNALNHKRCLWESLPGPNNCQEKFGICTVQQGACSWELSKAYKDCVKKHQQSLQQQAREI